MIDYEALAQGLAEMREALSAMVAGLVADGFTNTQARQIVTAVMAQGSEPDDGPDDSGESI